MLLTIGLTPQLLCIREPSLISLVQVRLHLYLLELVILRVHTYARSRLGLLDFIQFLHIHFIYLVEHGGVTNFRVEGRKRFTTILFISLVILVSLISFEKAA